MKQGTRLTMVSGAALLLAGLIAMVILFQFREPPAEASIDPAARALHVETIPAEPISHQVTLTGFATARPAQLVAISPQVSGVVTWVHPELHAGGRVSANEPLLRIDATRYETDLAEARADTRAIRAELETLRMQHEVDTAQASNRERALALAHANFERAQTLFAEYVGNRVDMERAEQDFISVRDELVELRAAINVYPTKREQLQGRLAAAEAAVARAELALAHTELRAPFAGRIDEILATSGSQGTAGTLGPGFYASNGAPLLTLADDSTVELPAKLDAADARRWLPTEIFTGAFDANVYPSRVRWAESPDDTEWTGVIDRVENLDSASRTLTVVVQVAADTPAPDGTPLSPGMFCDVTIPGKTLENVYRIPRAALSVDSEVYIARDERLAIQPVTVLATQDDMVLIRDGVSPGDAIITTRLVNPLAGTKLMIAKTE